jgi:hypothetical protein
MNQILVCFPFTVSHATSPIVLGSHQNKTYFIPSQQEATIITTTATTTNGNNFKLKLSQYSPFSVKSEHDGDWGSDNNSNGNSNGDGDDIMSEEEKEELLVRNVHDYIYIDDAIDAILAAMQFSPEAVPSSSSLSSSFVVNVGSGQGTTINRRNNSSHGKIFS